MISTFRFQQGDQTQALLSPKEKGLKFEGMGQENQIAYGLVIFLV